MKSSLHLRLTNSLCAFFLFVFIILQVDLSQAQIKERIQDLNKTGAPQSFSIDLSLPTPQTQKIEQEEWKKKVDPMILWSTLDVDFTAMTRHKVSRGLDENSIGVLLKVEDESVVNTLPGFTLTACSPRTDICNGYLDLDYVQPVASNPGVLKMEASRIQHALHYNSRAMIGVDKIHEGQELPQPYKGEDVIVGVIDSGIDFDHPDFQAENGTRLLYLLEYSATQPEPYIWSKNDIDQKPEEVTQIDGAGGSGHGTHVTGSAAGGGKSDAQFTGMAPESDIIFVKGIRDHQSNGGFEDNDVLNGVNTIFSVAEQLGKPAVVNLSLGGNYGPMDGTSLYEQYLTQLQGKGKIIVAAAGNEGFDYLNANTTILTGEITAVTSYPTVKEEFFTTIWYDKGAITNYRVMAIGLNQQNQFYIAGDTDWLATGTDNLTQERGIELIDPATENPAGYILHYSQNVEDEGNGDGEIQIKVFDGYEVGSGLPFAYLENYLWITFLSSGSGPGGDFNLYSNGAENYPYQVVEFNGTRFLPGNRNYSVGTPATADSVISVGAFVSTNSWTTDLKGPASLNYPLDFDRSEFYTPEIGEIAYFSSRGPTRDGRMAPVITAPGDKIFSARSFDIETSILLEYGMHLMGSGDYVSMQGTSMATPHITGIIALMLQINPNLSYKEIVEIFSTSVTRDEQTGNSPNNIFGYGRIDAYKAIKSTLIATYTESDPEIATEFKLLQNYPNPFNPSTTIGFILPKGSDVSLDVYSITGQKVATLLSGQLSQGYHDVQFDASALSTGIYYYRLTSEMGVQTRSMILLK